MRTGVIFDADVFRRAVSTGFLISCEGVAGDVELVAAEEANHVEEGGQHADSIRTAAKAKKPDLVPIFVGLAQKAVGAKNVVVETIAGC
jgi:hypothetical protein